MKEARLFSSRCSKHSYRKVDGESAFAANTLDRQFTVSGPNQLWCDHVTYIWAGCRWIYLAAVMDLYARRIVGWPYPIDLTRDLRHERYEWPTSPEFARGS